MDSNDIVSIVALIVSVIALIGTILQLLQQYFASATGYSNCGEQTMGPWAQTRKRIFRADELRFEVRFEAPVMFVCAPDNKRGPVPREPIRIVNGTELSESQTLSLPFAKSEQDKKREEDEEAEKLSRLGKLHTNVHTADNELATWVVLLQALQQMEYKSQEWQVDMLKQNSARSGPKAMLPASVAGWEQHTAAAALQRKVRSWDSMPSEMQKPYATTTICHIVEMAAMLGLHWRDFDRSNHRYHAEGNGYLLTGHDVADLGVTFSFRKYGTNNFHQNRVIPSDEIKLMAFGNVSTIYRPGPGKDGKTAPFDVEDPKNSWVLQFGSTNELVESLQHFGCNAITTNYFRDPKKKHGHLFPIAFEVLGMLAKPIYMPDTYYRYLPNPTTYTWNKKNFSLRKLILEFSRAANDDDIAPQSDHILQMQRWVADVAHHLENQQTWRDNSVFPMELLRALNDAISKCDRYLKDEGSELVSLVIREHIHEVMRLLNTPVSSSTSGASEKGDEATLSYKEQHTFDELSSAGPEEKQQKFMDIYFTTVAQAVTRNCHEVLRKKKSTKYVHTPQRSHSSVKLGGRTGSDVDASQEPSETTAGDSPAPQLIVTGHETGTARLRRMSTSLHEQLTANIWCTLVFRMLCWLLLHDFHRKDVQISKSELYGSRLPVYIA
ncbi:hypothetical protein SLS53_004533 [Cytospora paraplurivora]|uniref:Modin n=1 Tax=Cytospora paraplurivora TaxID=2898453 RepID=A0AAN9YHB7_9PEZI